MKNYQRIQFRVPAQWVELIDNISVQTGANSRSEVLKAALIALDWMITHEDKNHRIGAIDENDDVVETLRLTLLGKNNSLQTKF